MRKLIRDAAPASHAAQEACARAERGNRGEGAQARGTSGSNLFFGISFAMSLGKTTCLRSHHCVKHC